MKSDVTKIFDKALADKFRSKTEVMNFLLRHPRKSLCIENLCEQIDIIEKRSYKITFEVDSYKQLIKDIAMMFAQRCLRHAEEQAISSIERQRRTEEGQKDQRMRELAQEFQKEGLIIDNDTDDLKLGASDAPEGEEEAKGL